MYKQSQSILFNIFPMQAVNMRRSPISNKEAQSLYEIWKSDKDEYGKFIVPDKVDSIQVANLTTKGVIRSPQSRYPGVSASTRRAVDITDMGKKIIRNIILYTEKSALGKSSAVIDYERIYVSMQNNNIKEANQKLAWRDEPRRGFEHLKNWLMRAREQEHTPVRTTCDMCDKPLEEETLRRNRSSACKRCRDSMQPARPMENREPKPLHGAV